MAGRPLRRLRNALKLNPLVGWKDTSGMSAATALEPFVPLVRAGAEDTYRKVYTRVGLPVAVALRPPKWFDRKDKAQYRKNEQEDTRLAERLGALLIVCVVPQRKGKSWYRTPFQYRGSPGRQSPYTPFVLLHRLGDALYEDSREVPLLSGETPLAPAWSMLRELRRLELKAFDDDEMSTAPLRSRGVDTAAGRMGVLGADVCSDLFAKWLLTGRIAYNPSYPPSDTDAEQQYRDFLAAMLPGLFQTWHSYLLDNIPMVVYV